MKNNFVSKALGIGIVILFFGASVVSAINNNDESSDAFNEIENFNIGTEKFYPTDDSEIAQDQADLIQGSNPSIIIRNEFGFGGSSGYASQGLAKFDISSISKNAIVLSATLYMYYNKWTSTNPAGRLLNIYRITSSWSEGTVTWNTQPTYHSSPTDDSPVPASTGIWIDWDVTSDVQDFVSEDETNYGWIITDDGYWGMSNIPLTQVRTKEYSQERSPYLEVEVFEPKKVIMIGRINDVDTSSENIIRFKAGFLRYIQLSPFSFNRYTLGEEIIVADSYRGILTLNFALGIFDAQVW